MLMSTVEAEVAAYVEAHQHEVDDNGRRLVVRNGHARERTLVSGVGPLKIRAEPCRQALFSMSAALQVEHRHPAGPQYERRQFLGLAQPAGA